MISRPGAWREGARQVWLPTASEMAQFDRRVLERGATVERALIECAGRELAHRVQHHFPRGTVHAIAGSGHNGADALVAARTLAGWGRPVRAFLAAGRAPDTNVLVGWDLLLEPASQLSNDPPADGVILDGILGTGLKGPPRDREAELIQRLAAVGLPVVAVDGPSGADLDSGAVPGACLPADLTVSFGWPKLGLLRFPAREYAGVIEAVEIGFPPPETPFSARAITGRWVAELLSPRPPDAHKARAGYLTIVSGQRGMAGAAVLAVRAGMRGGAGIVRAVSHPANREILQVAAPGAVFAGWDDAESVSDAVSWSHALAIGPGMGRDADRLALVDFVLEHRGDRPVVVDADGLSVWQGRSDELADRLVPGDVITPHPGELARLLDVAVEAIVADPPASATEAARRFGCTVVLKGAPSLVATGEEPLLVTTVGGSALAAGGSGDVLTGLIGSYLAAGMPAVSAAASALFLSGLAAELGSCPVGHAAEEIPDRIPVVREEIGRLPGYGSGSVIFASASPEKPGGGLRS